MVDAEAVAYVSFTALLVLTPGATTAVVVRNALAGGRRAGLAAAAGAGVANTSHATAAGLGLAVVFSRWPLAMTALTWSGAIYLAWLGIRSLHRVVTQPDGGLRMTDASTVPAGREQQASGFRQGLAVNLLNPAIATFYLVVLPSFLPDGASPWRFVAFAAVHVGMALCSHSAWALALDRLRRLFRPAAARRLLEGATGLALIGLAARVLWP